MIDTRQQIESVLYSNAEPEEKVYKIARILHNESRLDSLSLEIT